MSAPYQRRRDPQPVGQGWEVAIAVIGGALLGVGLAALSGLGLASALFGHGWVWPHAADSVVHVLGGIITGHPGRGLDAHQASLVAATAALYLCVAVCELVLIVAAILAGVLLVRYRRPGDPRGGMATRREAEQVLGPSGLRSAREIIRPDIYAPLGSHPRRGDAPRGSSTRRVRVHRSGWRPFRWRASPSALTQHSPIQQRNDVR
jgi:hypothetical protein